MTARRSPEADPHPGVQRLRYGRDHEPQNEGKHAALRFLDNSPYNMR